MFAMAALLGIALVSNWMVKPVHKRHHMTKKQMDDDII
jgi:hypothetical protein